MLNSLSNDKDERTLPRTMGYFSGTMLCVGMIIGSGIFSTPAIILGLVGSIGMTFVIFAIGALVSFFGVLAYCELGCMRPYSGGEKEYLDYCFPHPKALLSFLFTQCMVCPLVIPIIDKKLKLFLRCG
jgi:amino acid transporter